MDQSETVTWVIREHSKEYRQGEEFGMSDSYRFSTNRKMLINNWDECFSELTGEPASVAVGKKYYDVFPRLFFRQKDAVAYVLEKQKKLVMKGHVFRCLSHNMTADVTINPLLTPRGLKGAEINVSNVSAHNGCGPGEMRRLMTLGKTGPALAHGVRNSLNAIHGAVSFISQKYSDEKVIMEFTRIMQEEIARLVEFISMFLAASCADMTPSLVDINAALKKIEKLIFFQLMTRNISSDFRYSPVPAALINPFQFDQAVLNIVNNAIEAIDADGELTVTTALESSSEKDFIVIEVSDDGPGMPADRSSAKIAAGKRGKGFGLQLTEEIMNNCGGHMDMRRIQGKGTAVRLYIPAQAGGGT